MSFTTLTETVGEGELSFTLKWEIDPQNTSYLFVDRKPGSHYLTVIIAPDGSVRVGDGEWYFDGPNDVKLHLALLKWIYIRGRELTKNPNMEAW